MKIKDVLCSKGKTGFFFDDQKAIQTGAFPDGANYRGTPVTGGFTAVRQAGESVSVMLVLEDGQIAYGDCAAVQYSGAGGRDPLFLADQYIPVIERCMAPLLTAAEPTDFGPLAESIDRLVDRKTGKRLHTAIRYGVTQAILDAAAKCSKKLMAEVAAETYGTEVCNCEIPILAQSGDNRYVNADKMFLKGVSSLPHGLINNVEKLGVQGEKLLEYVQWLKKRYLELRLCEGYRPVLHLDVYGTIGAVFNYNIKKICAYFEKLEQAAYPLLLRIESPVDMKTREQQAEALKTLTEAVDRAGLSTRLVADEWCNTYEDVKYFADNRAGHMIQIKTPDLGGINNSVQAVLYCKKKGIGAYLGGSCNETERSAQICTHLAMATGPELIMAKPGMGVDEGLMIVYNEMQRILALRKSRQG
jgi:methylaspartate ammonia-lyase